MTRLAALLLLAILGYLLFVGMDLSPGDSPNPTAAAYVRHGPANTGAANIVTSIYLGYRMYDTLGEAIVLFISVVGVSLILTRKGADEP